jgi:hypothetical protein
MSTKNNFFFSSAALIVAFYLTINLAFGDILYNHHQTTLAQTTAGAQQSMKSYENTNHGIRLQYPTDWTESTSGIPAYNGIIVFYSPLRNLTDVLPAEVTVSITSYSNPISLDEYTKVTLAALEQQGIKIDNSAAHTLAGNPGYSITFSPSNQTSQSGLDFKMMQAWTVIDNKVYLLSFNADTSKFDAFLPTAQKIIDSLQVQRTP